MVDVFFRGSYCGYWATGIEHDPGLGWLAFEHGGDDACTAEEKEAAVAAWREGKPLPPLFHRFDHAAAARCWKIGVERWGSSWYVNGDGNRYDVVVQLGVLGEER